MPGHDGDERALFSSYCTAIDVFRTPPVRPAPRSSKTAPGDFSMSLDSDVIVDRRRLRRKLTFWRVAAAVVAIAAIVTIGVIATPGGRGALTASGSIARINIEGLIRSDQ